MDIKIVNSMHSTAFFLSGVQCEAKASRSYVGMCLESCREKQNDVIHRNDHFFGFKQPAFEKVVSMDLCYRSLCLYYYYLVEIC